MTDNGKEFISTKLVSHLADLDIKHNDIPTYIPAINDKVERVTGTIIEGTCLLMKPTNVPINLVGCAAQYVCD